MLKADTHHFLVCVDPLKVLLTDISPRGSMLDHKCSLRQILLCPASNRLSMKAAPPQQVSVFPPSSSSSEGTPLL